MSVSSFCSHSELAPSPGEEARAQDMQRGQNKAAFENSRLPQTTTEASVTPAENLTGLPSKANVRRRNAIETHLGSSHGNDENMKNTLKHFYHPGVQTESRNIRINTHVCQRRLYLVYVQHYRTSHSLRHDAAPPNNSPVCSLEQVISADQAWFKSLNSLMRLINAQKHIFIISPACNIKNQGLILHLASLTAA